MNKELKKYTVNEAAIIFRRTPQTIRRWISEGRTFKVLFKIKDGYLIPEKEIERVLSDNKISDEP